MKEINLKVEGMACTGCENRIQKVLENIEGVQKVEAHHENGTVKVTCKENVNEELLIEKIDTLGYEVIEEKK